MPHPLSGRGESVASASAICPFASRECDPDISLSTHATPELQSADVPCMREVSAKSHVTGRACRENVAVIFSANPLGLRSHRQSVLDPFVILETNMPGRTLVMDSELLTPEH